MTKVDISAGISMKPPGGAPEGDSKPPPAEGGAQTNPVLAAQPTAAEVFVELEKQPVQLTFEMPLCGHAKVNVFALFGSLKNPRTGKRRKDEELRAKQIYTGHIGTCSRTFFWPDKLVVPIDQRASALGYSSYAWDTVFWWGCCKWWMGEGISLQSALLDGDTYLELKETRTELDPFEHRLIAASRYGVGTNHLRQKQFASVHDPVFFDNCDATKQCCMQKDIAYSTIYEGNFPHMAYTLKSMDAPAWHPILPGSSRCCKNHHCCTCDCGCGEMRSLKFRCCCCGDFTHRYPVYESKPEALMSFDDEPVTHIVVRGTAGWNGRTSSDDLKITVDPPKKIPSRQHMQLLIGLAMDVGLTYMKPF